MTEQCIKKIVIVGGGTAGWMTAAALAKFLEHIPTEIMLIESSDIGTIGVGEATLPGIRDFNRSLGIDEVDFIKKTQATFKLAIEFKDWSHIGKSFFHPFSDYGMPIGGLPFHQYWRKSIECGNKHPLADYCLPIAMCRAGKFAQPHPNPKTPLADYKYAFHFDASLYAQYLREYAQRKGVIRTDAIVESASLDSTSGFIEFLLLKSGERISGDLFIDCSGQRGLLIEETLHTGFDDWSHWLPVDRAIAVQSEALDDLRPYTQSWAREDGWQWKIPLQNRVGNGYVFCSHLIKEEAATEKLLNSLTGKATTSPRTIRFRTGRRKLLWNKNCVAIGLASGFLEPLESTSISLIQTAIAKLLMFYPLYSFNPHEIGEANRLAKLEFERIRDFIILHYYLSDRTDSELWRSASIMAIPSSLSQKISLYRSRGHFINFEMESFLDSSWLSLYNGFDLLPEINDIRLHSQNSRTLIENLNQIRDLILKAAEQAPSHTTFINQHCRSD